MKIVCIITWLEEWKLDHIQDLFLNLYFLAIQFAEMWFRIQFSQFTMIPIHGEIKRVKQKQNGQSFKSNLMETLFNSIASPQSA